jgi:hypothetical protein
MLQVDSSTGFLTLPWPGNGNGLLYLHLYVRASACLAYHTGQKGKLCKNKAIYNAGGVSLYAFA